MNRPGLLGARAAQLQAPGQFGVDGHEQRCLVPHRRQQVEQDVLAATPDLPDPSLSYLLCKAPAGQIPQHKGAALGRDDHADQGATDQSPAEHVFDNLELRQFGHADLPQGLRDYTFQAKPAPFRLDKRGGRCYKQPGPAE